jgi:hypothetical protein
MADDADKAGPGIEDTVQIGIEQARSAPALRPRGRCHFCDECVIGKLLFCDRDCAEDFEAEEDQMKRAGKG